MEDVTLSEVLGRVFNYQMEGVYTALPGIILAVKDNGESLLVDVQPSVSIKTQTDEIYHRPVVLNVPIQMPSSNSAGVLFPVNIGDTVLMVFTSDAIDNFKYGDGKPTAPNDFRRFSIRDCVAIPGVYPKASSVNRVARHKLPHNPKDVVVYHNLGTGAETEVRLKQGTGQVIVTSPVAVTVNCKTAEVNASDSMTVKTKTFKIDCDSYQVSSKSYSIGTQTYSMNATSNASSTGTFSHNGSWTLNGIQMETHTHSGVQTGGGSTGGPQ